MLDEDQVTALNLAKNGHNLLITGQAGCGKTFLVKEIAKQLKNQHYVQTDPAKNVWTRAYLIPERNRTV